MKVAKWLLLWLKNESAGVTQVVVFVLHQGAMGTIWLLSSQLMFSQQSGLTL